MEYEYLHEQVSELAVKICNLLESKIAFKWRQQVNGKIEGSGYLFWGPLCAFVIQRRKGEGEGNSSLPQ